MTRVALVVLVAIVVLVSLSAFFVVSEGQTALVIELGKVRGEALGPGLHWKWPLITEVRRFDARVLAWDGDPERIPVKDSKFIFVDTFARWRIVDAKRFYNAVRDEQGAQSRLDDILDGSVRDVVSTHYLLELVRTSDEPIESERLGFGEVGEAIPAAEDALEEVPVAGDLEAAGKRVEVRDQSFGLGQEKLQELDLGIELVDFRIKRIDYTPQVQDEVYHRMISQQERIAERYRAQGEGHRAEIAGGTAQERKRIESESYRRAQEIKGEGEAESTRIYAEAYGQDEEFYRFMKSLETYEEIFGGKDTLILSTSSDLLRYLESQR